MASFVNRDQQSTFRKLDEYTKQDLLEKVAPTYVELVSSMQTVFKDMAKMATEMESFLQLGYRLNHITDDQVQKLSRQSKLYFPELFRQKISELMLSLPKDLSAVNLLVNNVTSKLAKYTPQLNNLFKQHNLPTLGKETRPATYDKRIVESTEDILKAFEEYADNSREELRQSLETKIRLEQANRRGNQDPHIAVVREILAKADAALDEQKMLDRVGYGEADLEQFIKRPAEVAPDAKPIFVDFTASQFLNQKNRVLATVVWPTKDGKILQHVGLEFGLDGGFLGTGSSEPQVDTAVKVKDGFYKTDLMLAFECASQAPDNLQIQTGWGAPATGVAIAALRGTPKEADTTWGYLWEGQPYSQLTQAVVSSSGKKTVIDSKYPIFTSCDNSIIARQISSQEFLLFDTFLGKTSRLEVKMELKNAKLSLDYDINSRRPTIFVLNSDSAPVTPTMTFEPGTDAKKSVLHNYRYSIFLWEGESGDLPLIEEGSLELPELPEAIESVYYHPKTALIVTVANQNTAESVNTQFGKKLYSAVLLQDQLEPKKAFKLAEVNTLHLVVEHWSSAAAQTKSTFQTIFSPLYATNEKKSCYLFLISLDPSMHILAKFSSKGMEALSATEPLPDKPEKLLASRVISPGLFSIFQHQQLSSIGLFGVVEATEDLKVRMNMYLSSAKPAH